MNRRLLLFIGLLYCCKKSLEYPLDKDIDINVASTRSVLKRALVRDERACADPVRRKTAPQCDWDYMAYFPRIFRTGITENFMVSTQGFPHKVNLTVRIVDSQNNSRVVSEVQQFVPPETLTTIPAKIHHKAPPHVKIHIQGIGKIPGTKDFWLFDHWSESISVEGPELSILIQTDRPIYKPGQTIRARVVVINSNLKPYGGKLDIVSIANPSGSILRLWKDVYLEDGFASFELKTSTKPVLGEWTIKAGAKNFKKHLQIRVEKYVLPKFQVTIEPPTYITKMMESITAKVCAKYSYGKDVIGKMNATVCLEQDPGMYKTEEVQCITSLEKIEGCTDLNINLAHLKQRFPSVSSGWFAPDYYITINARVKETATDITLQAETYSEQLMEKDVELTIETKPVFKPGFPHLVKLLAKHPDGTPIKHLDVTFEVKYRDERNGISQTLFIDDYFTITNGVREVSSVTFPFYAKSATIIALYSRPLYKGEVNHINSNEIRKSSATSDLIPWYSPSHSYLSIQEVKGPVTIGSTLDILVGYSAVDPMAVERKISYSLMCGGNLVASNTVSKTFTAATAYKSYKTTTVPASTPWYWGSMPVALDCGYEHCPSNSRLPARFTRGDFTLSVNVTQSMSPSCRMLVHFMRKKEVVADEAKFEVLHELQNQVSMKFDQVEVKPGASVKLTVKGAPNSRIAVAAVDKSVHFLAQGNDIKVKQLMGIIEKSTMSPRLVSNRGRCPLDWRISSSNYVDSESAFANVGAAVLSSLQIDVRPCEHYDWTPGIPGHQIYYISKRPDDEKWGLQGEREETMQARMKNTAQARIYFPETWLWTDEILSSNGTQVFDVRVPDSITTWSLSGFGISKTAGVGVANPTEIRVFQPFFISLSLPYSVIRGEDVTIPTSVFSYLDGSCMAVRLSVEASKDYDMVTRRSTKFCLCPGKTGLVLFRLKPKTLGHINLRVSAQTLTANICKSSDTFNGDIGFSDIVVQKLLVEAEGTKAEYVQSVFLCPANEPSGTFSTNLELPLPAQVVPGSIFGRVEIIGDVMGSSVSNVDELLAMPSGCGEQNMVKFAPNIFIMNYLNNSGQVDNDIKEKALDFMRTGYQRELTYKHTERNEGAYSIWGNRDHTGSTWLTAFVLKSYAQARSWIDIDPNEIKATLSWLTRHQNPKDGCFMKVGELHNKAMAGGVKSPATLSAYVVISLLEAGLTHQSMAVVSGASCVEKVFREISPKEDVDSYSIAIMAYMFAKLNNEVYYKRAMDILDKTAVKKDGIFHWAEKTTSDEDMKSLPWYWSKPRSTDIEQTAYVLLAKLTWQGRKGVASVMPIVKWLSKQRNSLGGWSSTQDTVLAMQALAEFAVLAFSSNIDMDVEVNAGKAFEHNLNINNQNKNVLQRIKANIMYNVEKVLLKPKFSIDVKIFSGNERLTIQQSCRSQTLKVCTSWLGDDKESNMAIIDVRMVSGFTADEEQFKETVREASTMDLKDIEVKEKSLIFYLLRIGKTSQCVRFRVEQTTDVKNPKPAAIKVYDYYDKGQSVTAMYNFSKKQCCGDHNMAHRFCRMAGRSRRSTRKKTPIVLVS